MSRYIGLSAPLPRLTNICSYDKNASESPLLSLPPELRNRVYRLVLGGRAIHLEMKKGRICHAICQCSVTEEELTKSDRSAPQPAFGALYDSRHEQCGFSFSNELLNAVRHHLSLTLLLTCRQIHEEAALIPFANNTFELPYGAAQCLSALLTAQAQAIQSVVLVFDHGDTAKATNAMILERKLRGLKRLFGIREMGLRRSETSDLAAAENPLLMLEGLQVEHAVVVARTKMPVFIPMYGWDTAVVEAWASDTERRLMAPSDGLTWKERHALPQPA